MTYNPEERMRYSLEQQTKGKIKEENKNESSLEYVSRCSAERNKIMQEKLRQYNEECLRKNGQTPHAPDKKSLEEHMYVDADKPGTMDNGTATIWYIIVMLIGAVFNDRLIIWVFATIIWWRHINRKARRQKEWDEKHKGGKK